MKFYQIFNESILTNYYYKVPEDHMTQIIDFYIWQCFYEKFRKTKLSEDQTWELHFLLENSTRIITDHNINLMKKAFYVSAFNDQVEEDNLLDLDGDESPNVEDYKTIKQYSEITNKQKRKIINNIKSWGDIWTRNLPDILKLLSYNPKQHPLTENIVFLDHIYDLQHNQGNLFNHTIEFSEIHLTLNIKRDEHILAYKDHSSIRKDVILRIYNILYENESGKHYGKVKISVPPKEILSALYNRDHDPNVIKFLTQNPNCLEWIKRNPQYATTFAEIFLQRRWSEAEPYIMKDVYAILRYTQNVINKGKKYKMERWPEAEPYIIKNPRVAGLYALNIIKDRWLKAEPYIMKDSEISFDYARNIINGRWPEAEDTILKGIYGSVYRKAFM